ncbi:MAG: phosphodiester glycosidase family protein [Pseudomonadota bacterium]
MKTCAALLLLALSCTAFAADPTAPYVVERLELPGPVAGVVVKVDLRDPRVQVSVALADNRDPDGPGPAVGLLDTTSGVARRRDFDITLNASFFNAQDAREVLGKRIRYFVGNGAYPVGWHFSDGKLVTAPQKPNQFRQALVVHRGGAISIDTALEALPADTAFAVSGNAMLVTDGQATTSVNEAREPRSAVGLSADGKTLILLAIDGRQQGYSRGVSMKELAQIFLDLGARNALNLDGGGSTSLVLKDPGSGGYAIANKPSDLSPMGMHLQVERPVVDVIGVRLLP